MDDDVWWPAVANQQLINRRQCPIEDCELPAIFSPLMSSDLTQVCTLKIVSLLMKAERKTLETFFAFLNNITGICKSPREKSSCIHLLRPLNVCQEISINYRFCTFIRCMLHLKIDFFNLKKSYNWKLKNSSHGLACVASVFVFFRSKGRPRNDEERDFRFWLREKTLVPYSLLRNRPETLATPAARLWIAWVIDKMESRVSTRGWVWPSIAL